MQVTRDDVLRFRVRAQELDRTTAARDAASSTSASRTPARTAPRGRWRSGVRGPGRGPRLAWTLRGAPHAYRRSEVAAVAAAVAPWSEADAAKRIFDASRPLKEAGIPVLDALDVIAGEMRDIARGRS